VFALLTSIVGATIGANLLLLGLDIAWDLQEREHPVRVAAAHPA